MSLTTPIPLGVTDADLAPADFRSADFDWTGFSISFIDSPHHPRFDAGYDVLWAEFGAKNEMEQREVIGQRMAWSPLRPIAGHAMLYEMVVVLYDNELAAVRDHTAIVDIARPDQPVTVHLSHLLITSRFRGSGLAGWMRAMPIRTARECLQQSRLPSRPVTLVAEMEPADPGVVDRTRRLAAYEKVGFLKVDPRKIHYLQPDFRSPDAIDASTGPAPVALSLVTRRVQRESEQAMRGSEARTIVGSLYTMYQQSFREQDMAPNWASLQGYPPDDTLIDLVPPTRPD